MPDYNKTAETPHISASVEHGPVGDNPKGHAIVAACHALIREANHYAVDATHSVVNVQWALYALRDAVEDAQGTHPSRLPDTTDGRVSGARLRRNDAIVGMLTDWVSDGRPITMKAITYEIAEDTEEVRVEIGDGETTATGTSADCARAFELACLDALSAEAKGELHREDSR